MTTKISQNQRWTILADDEAIGSPNGALFDAVAWHSAGAVTGSAPGRGTAVFLNTEFGPAVLKTYLRGGWVANFSRGRYVYTGAERSRPFLEFRVLAALRERGLPVPHPLAAGLERSLMFYAGGLLTSLIPDAQTLSARLGQHRAHEPFWGEVGRCIRRFHQAGAWHADLNARNVLLDRDEQPWMVDFDRARYQPDTPVNGDGNLRRLHRSLRKLWPDPGEVGLELAWSNLMKGYGD